jgi:hypothetical protein
VENVDEDLIVAYLDGVITRARDACEALDVTDLDEARDALADMIFMAAFIRFQMAKGE